MYCIADYPFNDFKVLLKVLTLNGYFDDKVAKINELF